MARHIFAGVLASLVGLSILQHAAGESGAGDATGKVLRAGAAAVDVTPTKLPVIVCGSFQERTADTVHDRLMARALVLDDGAIRLAVVVVDTLMMPRALIDEAKALAAQATGIAPERMLISATHTHSAPSVMACLGSRVDEGYRAGFAESLAKAVVQANDRLAPARVGWAVIQDPAHNHCRRWIFRPDRMQTDPFGQRSVRAHMHPGYQSPNHIGPAGPADPELSMLSVQSPEGRPIAVLANYAMHYFGSAPVSSDVCGHFGDALAKAIGAPAADPPFVGMLSQGTSGDSHWMDYSQPPVTIDLAGYTDAIAQVARQAYERISYHRWVSLAMAETTLRLRRRVPDEDRLAWARNVVAGIGDRLPRELPEIYAWEQLYLHAEPEVELKLQAVRIAELGITAIPNEVFGITGLKIKAQSPLQPTFNIELANGGEGYIPPPEQHRLGGYTTWAARTAGLEEQAEPRIVAAILDLLETVSGRSRLRDIDPLGPYAEAVLRRQPTAYWRLNEMEGVLARDAVGKHDDEFEPGIALYLPGVPGSDLAASPRGNPAVHFAGGRIRAGIDDLGDAYSVEFWFWNGLPHDARPVTGYLFSRGPDGSPGAPGDHLGIGGTHRGDLTGRLFFFNGESRNQLLSGSTSLQPKTWYHVLLVREGKQARVYLNGQSQPEIVGELDRTFPDGCRALFFGGRSDGFATLEGRLDEIAVYARALAPEEISR